ncbi:MAG: S8 family serine peptidase, partial [Oscillospiraceae bacterium]|nr:S8 family serine peptidase [Oscillospiraceae bacterium]
MKKILGFLLAAVVMVAALPLLFSASAAGSDVDGEYVLDEIIIKFLPRESFPGEEKQYDDEVAKVLKDGLDLISENEYLVKSEDFKKNPNATLNRYKNSSFIEYVQPNYIAHFDFTPNDPNYKSQATVLTVLGAQAGWDIINGGGPIIAVIDSGIAVHPDLPAPVSSYSAVASLAANSDKLGHGTTVAGTVGMVGNNGIGGAGINWDAQIMNVKVDDSSGTLTVANISKGIVWATDNGARILNLSLGTVSDSATLKNAIDYAFNRGCAIFAATGN